VLAVGQTLFLTEIVPAIYHVIVFVTSQGLDIRTKRFAVAMCSLLGYRMSTRAGWWVHHVTPPDALLSSGIYVQGPTPQYEVAVLAAAAIALKWLGREHRLL